MKDEKGAIDWTVGKLLSAILLIVLLVLIIYGITTNGFGPLIENVGGKFDEILIWLNIKDEGVGGQGCFNSTIVELTGGPEFLASMGLGGDSKAFFSVCSNGDCKAILGGEEYRYKGPEIIELNMGDKWEVGELLNGNPDETKFYRSLYWAVVDELGQSVAKEFFDGRKTRKFMMTGDGANIPIIGDNYDWKINVSWRDFGWLESPPFRKKINQPLDRSKDKIPMETSEEEIFNDFYEQVKDPIRDDNVQFGVSSSFESEVELKSVGTLWGDASDTQVDGDDELEKLWDYFERFKSSEQDRIEPKPEEVQDLINYMSGRALELEGVSYEVLVEPGLPYPVISLQAEGEELIVEYEPWMPKTRTGGFDPDDLLGTKDYRLKESNFKIYRLQNNREINVADPLDYLLKDEDFNKVYRLSKVNKFLGDRCS